MRRRRSRVDGIASSSRMFLVSFDGSATSNSSSDSSSRSSTSSISEPVPSGSRTDCGIESKWKLQSEQAAVEELKRRAIIEVGETTIKGIPSATLNIGFKGNVGEQPELKQLAEHA